VKLRATTLDRIASAYADAVAAGDFAAAEGWLATAWLVAERTSEAGRHRGHLGAERVEPGRVALSRRRVAR
jgi:hypothetical protein